VFFFCFPKINVASNVLSPPSRCHRLPFTFSDGLSHLAFRQRLALSNPPPSVPVRGISQSDTPTTPQPPATSALTQCRPPFSPQKLLSGPPPYFRPSPPTFVRVCGPFIFPAAQNSVPMMPPSFSVPEPGTVFRLFPLFRSS